MKSVSKSHLILTAILAIITLGLFLPGFAYADFPVAITAANEMKPAVAYNSNTGKFLVAYLIHTGDHDELRCQLHNADGSKSGGVINPLPLHEAYGRPAIAYNPNTNRFFVAVPASTDGFFFSTVFGRFLDGNGTPLTSGYRLFLTTQNTSSYYNEEDDDNALHVVCNTILNEFMVTVQRKNINIFVNPPVTWSSIDAQRISISNGVSPVINLSEHGNVGLFGHAIAYAPIAGTTPAGGRYLFSEFYHNSSNDYLREGASLLDSQGNTITTMPLYLGKPEGKSGIGDIAYGEVQGRKRFFLVYSDIDNYKPAHPELPWTGVWGTYVDPTKTSYGDTPNNTPFPISYIPGHNPYNENEQSPRVSYNSDIKAFYVVWREIPTLNAQNDESRSHIRGNIVDYFVEDGIYETDNIPLPASDSNVVISDVTGTCTYDPDGQCLSNEDPMFPDVSGSYGSSAVVVWHQKYSPSNLDVKGDFLTYSGECGFTDVPPGHWAEEAICKVYDAGITQGCWTHPLRFCPDVVTNREQMAVFLGRGVHGSDFTPPDATGIFSDVVTWWAIDWIEQAYHDGITQGCATNPLRYCPTVDVTRAQMAVFLLRAKHGGSYTPPDATGIFSDVDLDNWAADWIEQLYNEGITVGCGTNPLRFCPNTSVTRAQMAVFLMRTFGL